MSRVSSRARAIKPTLIRKVTDQARPGSLHLGLGQPDLPVPDIVREAVRSRVELGIAPYSPNLGLVDARVAVAGHYGRDPAEVMLTVGVQEAMAVAIYGLVEDGDDVLVPDPGFPAYANLVASAGARPVPYRLSDDFDLDPAAIVDAATSDTTVIILNSPSNPTGGVSSRQALAEVVSFCADNGIRWISDEIYEDFVWGGEHVSPSDLTDDLEAGVVLSGLSKTCAMMGWRIGWLLGSAGLVEELKPLHQHLVTCAPTLAQHAAVAALEHHRSIVDDVRGVFVERRRALLDIFSRMPTIGLAEPRGAFYAFPDLSRWCDRFGGSVGLCQKILDEADVVTIPGAGFGAGGEGHIRIAYTCDVATLEEALGRVFDLLEKYKPS